ncbi:CpaD family pilus assembly protein [Agrobacterium vitis]|uniref:CpaD family pilus assembly protein n=1 Tax=Agrobacterium vitis TaxID=373 RepID=UPI0018D206EC|nr:CpaD family pilus assembly protein [Agrobacterium vitis]
MTLHPTLSLTRASMLLLGLMAILPLASCGGMKDEMSTGSIPDDYRTRHPIIVTDVEHSLDLPVAQGSSRLTIGMSDAVTGFAQDYRNASTGYVQILVPQGSPNTMAASSIARQVHSLLVSKGIAAPKIVERPYRAGATGDAAPIRLSYVATTAVAGPCGQWPEDLSNDTAQNKNWQNFGCASQANLAAQVASPTDLIAPRGMTPIDAERRSTVIDNYRDGKDTSTTTSTD